MLPKHYDTYSKIVAALAWDIGFANLIPDSPRDTLSSLLTTVMNSAVTAGEPVDPLAVVEMLDVPVTALWLTVLGIRSWALSEAITDEARVQMLEDLERVEVWLRTISSPDQEAASHDMFDRRNTSE